MAQTRARALDAQWEVFAPLGGSRADAIAQRMTEAITLGLLVDGEQLPPEVEMAQQFGVSTLTLREALAELRRQGLVATKRGRGGGSFVQSRRNFVARLCEQLMATTASELRDRGDEQVAIAGAAARLAALRADSSDVARLRNLVDQLAAATDQEDRRRTEARFHIDVAVASQSIRLTRAQVRLQGETGALLWLVAAEELDLTQVLQSHRLLVDAIVAEDPRAAQDVAQDHADRVTRALSSAYLRLGPS